MQDITDFYRVAQERGFARDFMLRVRAIGEDTFNEDDFVYITSKQLPDRSITNQPVPYMGLVFNVPGTVTYPGSDSWSVTFRNDMDGAIRRKLEDWNISVFDNETSVGDISVRGEDKVIQLDLIGDGGDGDVRNTYKLYGVYCKTIGTVDHNNEGAGAITTFTAQLAYHFWRHE